MTSAAARARRNDPWTPEEDAALRWAWEQDDTRTIARKIGRTPMAIYHRVAVLGIGLGRPRGGEYVYEAAQRCGVDGDAMRAILIMAGVRLRRCRWNPHTQRRNPRARWVLSEDADRAMALWLRSETVTDAAARVGMSRYALSRILTERGLVMRYGERVLRCLPEHADAICREWWASGGQRKGPRSTRYVEPRV